MVQIAPDAGSTSDWKQKSEQLNGVDLAVFSVHLPCGPLVECQVENHFSPQGLLRIRVDEIQSRRSTTDLRDSVAALFLARWLWQEGRAKS